jgi:hypothetical protein
MPERKPINPFYVDLVPVGILFGITACAYTAMLIRPQQVQATESTAWIGFLDRYGLTLIVIELAVLFLLTIAAIGSDDYWTNRRREYKKHDDRP